jgi:hypothetical protein
MIKKFDTFNEAKLFQGDLLEDVTNAFAYLVDENPNIKIYAPKSDQVKVLIPSIISPSRKYTIEEYADVTNRWNEIVQDTWVATQQLTDKGTISVDTYIEGLIRLSFFINNNNNTDVFKVNTKTVYVSKVNLLKSCKLPSCDIKVKNETYNYQTRQYISFTFDKQQSSVQKNEILSNIRFIANKYGITLSPDSTESSFYLKIYLTIPVNKKIILKDLV